MKKSNPIKGYKVTDELMQCHNFQYELNKLFVHKGGISICNYGFHYCPVIVDCFNYKNFDPKNRVFEILDLGTPVIGEDKNCTDKIKFIKELSWLEVLELCNTGKGNTGNRNAGNRNAGNDNAGNDNAGSYNTGNRNAGNRNAGNYNVGSCNAGSYNAGNRNAGNDNAGNDNAGNDNAGSYNVGYRNVGYSNAGNDNAGAFNNLIKQPYMLFNKASIWTYDDFINSKAFKYLQQVDTTLWIPDYKMSEEEKNLYPYYVTTKGYIKNLPYKEAFANSWNNWNNDARQSFKDLPNFDAEIFKDITGIEV